MSRIRVGAVVIVVLAVTLTASGAEASRAAENGRGLPPHLEADASDMLWFPAAVSILDPQVFVETNSGTGSFVLALGGERFRYGYFNDADRHNIVVGGPGGWGAALGFKDSYRRNEDFNYYDEDSYSRYDTEQWERSLRLALGWRGETAAGRLFELGVAGTLFQGEGDGKSFHTNNGITEVSDLRWKADHGLGFGVALRTLAAGGGLQAAVRFDYADLDPEEDEERFNPRIIRSGAGLDLGWSTPVGEIDDVVMGATVAWSRSLYSEYSLSSRPVNEREEIDYTGAVFLSLQERLREDLVVRGGFRGPAYFSIDKRRAYELDEQEYILSDESRDSRGATQSPVVYLGAGWTWKRLIVDARISSNIDLYNLFYGWGASWTF